MSSFNCEHCGAPCLDSPNGYTTGCEHYPPDIGPQKEPASTARIEAQAKAVRTAMTNEENQSEALDPVNVGNWDGEAFILSLPDWMDEIEKQECLGHFRNATGKFIPLRTLRDEMEKRAKQVPKIKPLVWERIGNHWIALTPIAAYEVWKSVIDGRWKWRQQGHPECYLDSEASAKAACQQEYERRVRECLE